MKKSDIFWQTYLSLEKEFINVSNFIFITDEITTHEHGKEITQPCNSQLETFSPYIADLLIRCCVQIEAISKELYYDNGGTKRVSRFLVGINFRHPNVMPNFAVWKTITYRHWHRWCCQPRF